MWRRFWRAETAIFLAIWLILLLVGRSALFRDPGRVHARTTHGNRPADPTHANAGAHTRVEPGRADGSLAQHVHQSRRARAPQRRVVGRRT